RLGLGRAALLRLGVGRLGGARSAVAGSLLDTGRTALKRLQPVPGLAIAELALALEGAPAVLPDLRPAALGRLRLCLRPLQAPPPAPRRGGAASPGARPGARRARATIRRRPRGRRRPPPARPPRAPQRPRSSGAGRAHREASPSRPRRGARCRRRCAPRRRER